MKPELMVRRFDIFNLKETILIDRRCANGLLRKRTGDDVLPAGYGYDAQGRMMGNGRYTDVLEEW